MRRLPELAALSPVLVLTGARQSGKTTLLRRIFPNHRYLSLDLPSLAEQAERSPDQFLAAYPGPADWPRLIARGLFPELWKRPQRQLPARRFMDSLPDSGHYTRVDGVRVISPLELAELLA
jgi:hypothetical protein